MSENTPQIPSARTPKPFRQVKFGREKFKIVELSSAKSCFFQCEGKTYRLEFRSGSWYPAFCIKGQRPRMSLDTSDPTTAIHRATQKLILPLKGKRWQEVDNLTRSTKSSLLSEIIPHYYRLYLGAPASARNSVAMLLNMFRHVRGLPRGTRIDPATISLTEITTLLLTQYQSAVVATYKAEAARLHPGDDKALREAQERALRSSRSGYIQARGLFLADLLTEYEAAGLHIPPCIREFATARAKGKNTRDHYSPPDDATVKRTFEEVEKLREADPECYQLFWLSLSTGMRRNESAHAKCAHFIDRDGRLWVYGGIGKDGRTIEIPVLRNEIFKDLTTIDPEPLLRTWLAQARAKGSEYFMAGELRNRYDTVPARLNLWLETQGWHDEKKLHALRAVVGSRLYMRDPHFARRYMRHKSLTTTEDNYSHFARFSQGVENI